MNYYICSMRIVMYKFMVENYFGECLIDLEYRLILLEILYRCKCVKFINDKCNFIF